MSMHDGIVKLDDFLKLSEHELLNHAGTISAEEAKTKAELEYYCYRARIDLLPRQVDKDFELGLLEIEKRSKTIAP